MLLEALPNPKGKPPHCMYTYIVILWRTLQSERLHLYQSYAQELLKSGSAYPCFCSKERLEGLRSSGTKMGYDGHCRRLSAQQVERSMDMGLSYTVRLKVCEVHVV